MLREFLGVFTQAVWRVCENRSLGERLTKENEEAAEISDFSVSRTRINLR